MAFASTSGASKSAQRPICGRMCWRSYVAIRYQDGEAVHRCDYECESKIGEQWTAQSGALSHQARVRQTGLETDEKHAEKAHNKRRVVIPPVTVEDVAPGRAVHGATGRGAGGRGPGFRRGGRGSDEVAGARQGVLRLAEPRAPSGRPNPCTALPPGNVEDALRMPGLVARPPIVPGNVQHVCETYQIRTHLPSTPRHPETNSPPHRCRANTNGAPRRSLRIAGGTNTCAPRYYPVDYIDDGKALLKCPYTPRGPACNMPRPTGEVRAPLAALVPRPQPLPARLPVATPKARSIKPPRRKVAARRCDIFAEDDEPERSSLPPPTRSRRKVEPRRDVVPDVDDDDLDAAPLPPRPHPLRPPPATEDFHFSDYEDPQDPPMPRRRHKLGPKTPIRKRPYESPKPRHKGGHYSDEDGVYTTPQGTRRQIRRRVAPKMPTPRREPVLGTRENPWDLCPRRRNTPGEAYWLLLHATMLTGKHSIFTELRGSRDTTTHVPIVVNSIPDPENANPRKVPKLGDEPSDCGRLPRLATGNQRAGLAASPEPASPVQEHTGSIHVDVSGFQASTSTGRSHSMALVPESASHFVARPNECVARDVPTARAEEARVEMVVVVS
ncbi:hypothetical protein FN846DRAFT_885721 [Sphaerosporella brunnea]|uniref:Uncharacterized protein n=1 Tax=Sphaerosporella brunnea TaxID=1250544 RepID=A0A5J5FAR4_9PEZI|nr:hypothetical protein FN846DRAFT_885721 [Sphaerosporella brunnea]